MAADQAEITAAVDDQRDEVLKKINRVLRTVSTAVAELTELIGALTHETKRAGGVDENGEPTWTYLVKQPVPKDIYLTKKFLAYGAEYGFSEQSMKVLMFGVDRPGREPYEGFIRYYQRVAGQKNGKWSNWSLVFMKWVRSEHARKEKASAPGGPSTRFDQSRTRS